MAFTYSNPDMVSSAQPGLPYGLPGMSGFDVLERALKGSPLAVLIVDDQLKYHWMAGQHADWDPSIFLSKNHLPGSLTQIQEELNEYKRQVLLTGRPETFERWIPSPKGQMHYGRFTYEPLNMPGGRRWLLCSILDLTQSTQANLEATQFQDRQQLEINSLALWQQLTRLALRAEPILLFTWHQYGVHHWIHNPGTVWPEGSLTDGMSVEDLFDLGQHDEETRTMVEALSSAQRQIALTGNADPVEGWCHLRVRGLATDMPGPRRHLRILYLLGPGQRPGPGTSPLLAGKIYDLTSQRKQEEKLKLLTEAIRKEAGKTSMELGQVRRQAKATLRELADAHLLQIAMLPQAPALGTCLTISGRIIQSEQVGGDYYDFQPNAREGSWWPSAMRRGMGLRQPC